MIRIASIQNLPDINSMVQDSIKLMNERGNYQWDSTYPLPTHYEEDFNKHELYVYEKGRSIVAAVTVSEDEHSEYPEISWSKTAKAITIKRLVVSPHVRGEGIADTLFKFAEQVALEKYLYYIKTDTFSKNSSAQKLFARFNYNFVEKRYVEEKNDSILYYEKFL
ncbi:GNAT family N-acetyltransferase [Aquibacillus rhizosphaerae]|uniref:GNAT family N-acetyltransferase n=1 Tax=Aquibacillus rhizosphaerae TaxID=3051431 RepID=A0ABT7L2N9_9BACI|nr:GNAT family N-acetyltransferase [Aquibacillus sp. LR5S19]MDL4840135.1 GNAT family N-acetyltransferase [Aquibacillus sp. LR5S19]